eukprot:7365738-Prymnesium_polylepis.2
MAAAHSAAVHLKGLSPGTHQRLPLQQSRSSGRPKGSSRLHRRRYPVHTPRRSRTLASFRAQSKCSSKLVSSSLGRSTCSPKKVPCTTRAFAISGLAPGTFSIA